MLTITASLMASHWISLPHPETGKVLSRGVDQTPDTPNGDSLQKSYPIAFHFLYGNCPCSRRVLNHLVKRSPIDGVMEHIVLVGPDPELQTKAEQVGFLVDVVTPLELQSRYGVEAAPLLVVTDPGATILYSGGYTARKQSFDNQDEDILQRIIQGDAIQELPLYGCAVSQELKSIIDPLGLK